MPRSRTMFKPGNPYRWRPGQSGNPGGNRDIRKMIADKTRDGQDLVDWMHQIWREGIVPVQETIEQDGEKQVVTRSVKATTFDRMQAAAWLSDHLFGKPKAAEPPPELPPAAFDWDRLAPEEKDQMLQLMGKARVTEGEPPAA